MWSLVAQPWAVVVSWYLSPRAFDLTFSAERCWGESHGQEKFNKKSRCGVLGLFQLFILCCPVRHVSYPSMAFCVAPGAFCIARSMRMSVRLMFSHTDLPWMLARPIFDSHNKEAPEGDPGCFSRGIRGDPRGSGGIRTIFAKIAFKSVCENVGHPF